MDSYNETLSEAMRNAISENADYHERVNMIRVECHQFYTVSRSEGEVVKLMSASPQPTIGELLEQGPAFYIQQRRQEFGSNPENPESPQPPQSPATDSDPSFEDDGEALAGVYDIPDPDQYNFRWTHIPANNMRWVEKVLRRIEKEVEDFRFEAAQRSNSSDSSVINGDWKSAYSDEDTIIDNVFKHPLASPAAPLLAKGAEELGAKRGIPAREILAKALQDPFQLREVLVEAPTDGRTGGEISELSAVVDDAREQVTMLKATNLIPEDASPQTVWTYLNKAALKPRHSASLTSKLLSPAYWNFKQYKAIHGHAHGRFMRPSFGLFYPSSADGELPKSLEVEPSRNGVLQLFLYVRPLYSIYLRRLTFYSFRTSTGIHLAL